MIAVTGATGEVGRRVAIRLARRGLAQRLVVRDPSRAPDLDRVEVVRATYEDGASMRRALLGVRTLFLVSATEAPNRLEQHMSAVDAAVAADVERIVYLSFLSASASATFTFARDHFRTEQHIRKKGVEYTFLRPSLYLDLAPGWAGADGVIRGPSGDGRVAWVSRDDVADAAAQVLSGSAHDNATYDVTGPEALTLRETADLLSAVVGRPIVYRRETLDEARASRRSTGAPSWEIEGWISSYAAIATGELSAVSDAVMRLTGHAPQAMSTFLRAHPESFSHLRA